LIGATGEFSTAAGAMLSAATRSTIATLTSTEILAATAEITGASLRPTTAAIAPCVVTTRRQGAKGRACGRKLAPVAPSPELTAAATLADSLPVASPAWAVSTEAAVVALAERAEGVAEEHEVEAVAASSCSPFTLRASLSVCHSEERSARFASRPGLDDEEYLIPFLSCNPAAPGHAVQS
jgi:hypothetical protein